MLHAGNTVLNGPIRPFLGLNAQAIRAVNPRSTAFVCQAQLPQTLGTVPAPPVSKSLGIHHAHLRKTLARSERIRAYMLEIWQSHKRL